MVTAKETWMYQQTSARNSSYLNRMALLQLEHKYSLPCFHPSTPTANVTSQGQQYPDLHTGQRQDAVGGFLKLVPPYRNISYPSGNPYLKDSQCALPLPSRLGAADKQSDTSWAPQKRFLIFDQSGSHTRLFFSPSLSPQNENLPSIVLPSANVPCQGVAARADLLFKPIVEEKWDENCLTDGEDEMPEDTEEINALLYSDSEDDHDENDEVTSTGQSPLITEEGYNSKNQSLEELTEEVAISDESPKRQRLLNGKYKKSSLASGESPSRPPISCSYEDDVESSCAGGRNSCCNNIDSSKQHKKKVKIRQALKTLESIIPGLNTTTSSKDPLSIIDKAIAYLKSMQGEAAALGLPPGCKSATSP